jgi:hypothetical protein
MNKKIESRNSNLFRLFFDLVNLSKQVDFAAYTTDSGCIDLPKCFCQQAGTCNAIVFCPPASHTGWGHWALWGRDIAKQ